MDPLPISWCNQRKCFNVLSQISGNNGRNMTSLVCREKYENAVISPQPGGRSLFCFVVQKNHGVLREELMAISEVLLTFSG